LQLQENSAQVYLTVHIGKESLKPAPEKLLHKLQKVEVEISDRGQDGFQMVFLVEQKDLDDTYKDALLNNSLIKPFNRVRINTNFGTTNRVLIDGVITHHQLNPGNKPGEFTLAITGEDLSVMMDLKEKTEIFPNQSDTEIVSRIIKNYKQYGLEPKIITPNPMEKPEEINTVPSQHTTDLKYLQKLAKKHGYVFYIEPDIQNNTAYWGPPDRKSKNPKTLYFNMGELTNMKSIDFQMNSLKQSTLTGSIQDASGNQTEITQTTNAIQKLATHHIGELIQNNTVVKKLRESGITKTEAITMSIAESSISADAITATGELDAKRYREVLRARQIVELQGVGQAYSGLYYVKKVKHTIVTKGTYKQTFTLTREGLGTTI